jgi:hypothetical protein
MYRKSGCAFGMIRKFWSTDFYCMWYGLDYIVGMYDAFYILFKVSGDIAVSFPCPQWETHIPSNHYLVDGRIVGKE